MWDLRKRLFIIISIVVGFLIVIIFWAILSSRANDMDTSEILDQNALVQDQQSVSISELGDQTNLPQDKEKEFVPPPIENQNELFARQSARLFVERFLSYSNQNGNSHINDVLPLATTRMQNWIKNQGVEQNTEYSGITTKVVTSNVKNLSVSSATVNMGLQQIIQTMDTTKTVNKDARVELIKQNNDWKIDALYFEE